MKRAHRFLIFKISDDKSKVELEHIGARDSEFAVFKDLMPKDSCRYLFQTFIYIYDHRYAIYELEYQTSDARTESKILFLLYCPDSCNSAEKFVYATTKETLKK